MNKMWPMVPLAGVVRPRKQFVTIDDLATYKRPRVQLHAKGILHRDQLAGALIKTKRQQVCRAGEFLVAEIDAKAGGFGIVPDSLDGSIVSSHYFLFVIDEAQLDKRFLDYFIRTPAFRNQVKAQGSTNYAAIRPADVLAYKAPLPPLPEQQRLVARIDAIVGRMQEIRGLRQQEREETRQMLLGAFWRIAKNAYRRPMREVAPLVRRPVRVDPFGLYRELGVRSFGNGTFHKQTLSGTEIGEKRIFYIEPGDLLFSNVFAWEGAIAVAQPEDRGRVGSHRFITCLPKSATTTPRFLCFYFLTEEGLGRIQAASPGGALRNRTLGLTALENIQVPIPSIAEQEWFDTLQSKIAVLEHIRDETEVELDAFLPSVLSLAFAGGLDNVVG